MYQPYLMFIYRSKNNFFFVTVLTSAWDVVNIISKFNFFFFLQELPNIIVTVTQIMPNNSTTVPSYSLHIEHQHTNLHRKGIDKQYCNDYTNIYIGVHVANSAVLWESNWFIFLEVCHPRCVCENWKGYVVKHNYVN